MRFDGNRPGWRSHPPAQGEHTREILQSLGIDEGTIDELKGLCVI
jgi:crotonobetainyl-CoA:carnitine CoA-transferase CaiB-like acyl-CoA transferase